MVLDVQTTGLPKKLGFRRYHRYDNLPVYQDARVIAVAMLFRNPAKEIEQKFYSVIKPRGEYVVSPDALRIHGMTKEFIDAEGTSLERLVDSVFPLLKRNRVVIGYNVMFDKAVLMSELYRSGMTDALNLFAWFSYVDVLWEALSRGVFLREEGELKRNYSLPAVHRVLVGQDFQQGNALENALATLRCLETIQKQSV
jgi:DNA polymerase-3 subunit alpha